MSDLHAAERIKAEAMSIFNDPPQETSQDVRDVIEWYHAQLRIELARAALSAPAAEPVPQWQPIETAPKDGSMFIGWVAAERWTSLDGECSSRAHDTSQADFCWWRTVAESPAGGYFDNGAGQIGDAQDVTHWMPLPAAPQPKEPPRG